MISLAIFFVGSVGAAAAWNIWSLIAWRAVQGAGAAVFPSELRDHPRRVPAREGRRRDRARVGRLRDRWRLRDRALRRDRRQRLVALALHRRRRRDRHRDGARVPLRARVAGEDTVARRLRRRSAPVRRVDLAAGCADGRRKLGLDVRPHAGPRRRGARLPRRLGLRGAARHRADGRHADARPPGDPVHEHHGAHRRLRDVRDVRARAELRRDGARSPGGGTAGGRLRLRRERDEGRPLSPAKLVRTALRRADRRADRAADRVQMAARRGDAARLHLRRGARRVA